MKANFLIVTTVILLLGSCKKNKEVVAGNCGTATACPADVMCLLFSSGFRFTLTDKTTGSDLIFGSNPTLTPADVKLFIKSNSPYVPVMLVTDSSQRSINTFAARDTMLLQVKNEAPKNIIVKTFCAKDCCGVVATEIYYDGNLLIANDRDIFNIKR